MRPLPSTSFSTQMKMFASRYVVSMLGVYLWLTLFSLFWQVCCVAGLDNIKSKEDHSNAMKSFQEKEKMVRKASAKNMEAMKDGDVKIEELNIKVNMDQLLFEIQAEDFGDLIAELKATHNSLSSLLGGVGASTVASYTFQTYLYLFSCIIINCVVECGRHDSLRV